MKVYQGFHDDKKLKSTDVGETHDISSKHLSHSHWLAILKCYFSGVLFVTFGFCLLFR